jgi:hypothetical protein
LIAVLTSAVAAVALVFGMFHSVLAELVPPFDDSQQTVGIVSVSTVVVLLALTLLVGKRVTQTQTRWVALGAIALLCVALFSFFSMRDLVRNYVYRFPPASAASEAQTRHIRGDLHEKGRARLGDMTVAEAVYQFGGPDQVNGMGSLWHEDSRLQIISRMEREYVALIMLLTTAVFVAAIAVWRTQTKGQGQ